jgi:hypothetical protein
MLQESINMRTTFQAIKGSSGIAGLTWESQKMTKQVRMDGKTELDKKGKHKDQAMPRANKVRSLLALIG